MTRGLSGCGPVSSSSHDSGLMGVKAIEVLDQQVVFGLHPVDVDDFLQPRAFLPAVLLHQPVDQHAFAEAELFDHRAGDERVGPFPLVVGFGVAEEAVAVGMQFQDAGSRLGGDRFAVVGNVHRLVLAAGRPISSAAMRPRPAMPTPGMTVALVMSLSLDPGLGQVHHAHVHAPASSLT